jgi:DNA polymerase-3 subunit beta
MEIKIERKPLLDALHLAQGIVDRRVTLPILAHVLLTTENGSLLVAATDQEIGIRRRLDAQVIHPGAATAQARVLYDVVRSLPEGELTLTTLDRERLEIRCGRSLFRIVGLDPTEFPAMPSLGQGTKTEEITLQAGDLRRMLQRTAFAVCEDDTRLSLAGIYFDLREEGLLKLVATDGHRLSQESTTVGVKVARPGLIVPRKGISEMLKVLESAGESSSVRVVVGDGLIFLLTEGSELVMRPIQGEFPDYRQVVREQSPNRAEVPVGAWVDVLRRVEILSSERTRGVRLRFSEGLLEVSAATPDVGEASDAVEIRYTGQPLTMGFNVRYLLQALETFSRQALAEVGLKDEATQGVIRVDEDPSFLYVVMPMRL